MRLPSLLFLAFLPCGLLSADPVTLFDGKTLDGWDFDPKIWRVEDGMITGGSTTEKITENHFICTKKSFQNFELKLKIKVSGDPKTGMLNSGIQIRSLRVPGGAHMSGYQVDCGAGWFGKIYDEFRRNKVIWAPTPEQQAALDKAVDVFGWNEYRIRAEGPRIQTWINGVECIDYIETDKNIALDGLIAPQVHSGGVCLVQVKDVTVEELPPTPNAPTWESLGGVEAARKLVAPPPKKQADAAPATKRDISYNNVQGTALSAAEQQKKFHLPEGYEIELVVQESEGLGKFVSVYFDQRGRMWTQTALEYPVDSNENPAAAEAVYAGKGKDKVLVYPRESVNGPIPVGGLTDATVFADGLAIPLGILPWGNGDTCYVQHGHDLKLYKDTNGDGKADTFDVVLTGFGVQDSHLFPHQFTRAPGGWIWMAQGLFNNSKVHKPGSDVVVDWPKCSMARMRPDGSGFEVTSTGPNNIWGLVITGEGETFIQEANDYGYPVMPFHEYAYYPGGMEALKKSYQPDFPPTAEFRMGGTGLSGLALIEFGPLKSSPVAPQLESSKTPVAAQPDYLMAVANPITSKIQTIAMHRDGAYWKLEQLPDLITCDDPFFRPVGLTNGPDGAIYITDWYNKIISHNEVPRAHPDRDKTRGRIWRVKPKGKVSLSGGVVAIPPGATKNASPVSQGHSSLLTVRDFTKMSTDELIALLGTAPVAQAHLAWQTLGDRHYSAENSDLFEKILCDPSTSSGRRIQSLWTKLEWSNEDFEAPTALSKSPNSRVRKEGVGHPTLAQWSAYEVAGELGHLKDDPNPEVRFALIQTLGRHFASEGAHEFKALSALLAFTKPSLPGPLGPSSRGPKQIPIREAYDREFERFLVRMFLERHPDIVAKFLDSEAAAKLPAEARMLASLSLEPKASAARVAGLLPKLDRLPNEEELLRLAQFPEEAGVGAALTALLTNEKTRAGVADKLSAQRTKLDVEKVGRIVGKAANQMLKSDDVNTRKQALELAISFQQCPDEVFQPVMTREAEISGKKPVAADKDGEMALRLQAMAAVRSADAQTFYALAESDPDTGVRQAALEALIASSTNVVKSACERLFKLYPKLATPQRRQVLTALSGQAEGGAKHLVAAILDKTVPAADLDSAMLERLASVLGETPELAKLQQQLGGIFHQVLMLDGQDTAWVDSKLTLDGPFTVEAWVRLAPNIANNDSLLGSPGKLDMNFFQSKFRVWIGEKGLQDVCVSTKPMTPDLWTHLAVTRDEKGVFRIYQNGELDATGTKTCTDKFEDCRIGWSGPKTGTEGALTEFRMWKTARTAAQIRANFDRTDSAAQIALQRFGKGARLAKTLDAPPLLTPDQAKALDAKFTKLTALAPKGNAANGKALSVLCMACHQIGNAGGQIGPNLSGAGAMGLEAVLRNILTPNAAMEPGYRIFRVELINGDLVDAFFVSEDKDATIIRLSGQPDRRIPKKDIRSTKFIRRSLMPEGLLDSLPDQSVADLLAYLMTLKG